MINVYELLDIQKRCGCDQGYASVPVRIDADPTTPFACIPYFPNIRQAFPAGTAPGDSIFYNNTEK